jgi:hypothetical protein
MKIARPYATVGAFSLGSSVAWVLQPDWFPYAFFGLIGLTIVLGVLASVSAEWAAAHITTSCLCGPRSESVARCRDANFFFTFPELVLAPMQLHIHKDAQCALLPGQAGNVQQKELNKQRCH